jgi:cell wall-associated NlpC family hydrolase
MLAAGLIAGSVGCASAVRYTREAGAADRRPGFAVPRNWDYRKTYAVPPDRLAETAKHYLGIPYRFGGMSRRGTDCSGLVCMIYREVSHAKLPRSTGKLRKIGRVISLQQAKSGDLVFFRGGAFGRINHVGLYLSGRKFIHASTKLGVAYGSLDDAYYREHFVEARRIFK